MEEKEERFIVYRVHREIDLIKGIATNRTEIFNFPVSPAEAASIRETRENLIQLIRDPGFIITFGENSTTNADIADIQSLH